MNFPKWLQPEEEPLRLEFDECTNEAVRSDQDVELLVYLANNPSTSQYGFTLWNASNIPAFHRNKMGR